MDRQLTLGPFNLISPIGEGGMSQVWRGIHREQDVEVAVKIMRVQGANQSYIRQAFLREAQSVAKLLHPGIVRIFDYGQVPTSTSLESQGIIDADAPYIAMELATRGSLGTLNGIFNWRQLRWLLLEILNALAHAHARAIIHRDLKPDNVLMTAGTNGQTCLKLTDFGIVHFSDPDVSTSTSDLQTLFAGTPYYMSPEQLRGKWREFGPWTDLYSLGCMAYEACCGQPPYTGENLFEIAHQQMASELPQLQPRTTMPDGLEAWIHRMLQKDPRDRFQRAADAAWALLQLPDPPVTATDEDSDVFTSAQDGDDARDRNPLSDITWVLEDNPLHTTQNTLHTNLEHTLASGLGYALAQAPIQTSPTTRARDYHDAPPLPESWVRRQPPAPSIQLMGAGLNLYGLREIPYVSRERERTAIWEQLKLVHTHQRPFACLIRGQTGIGKTRLATWIHERAHEVGGAIVLSTTHAQDDATSGGLARMVTRALNCGGLARPKVYERILNTLSKSAVNHETADLDAVALTQLIAPGDDKLSPDGPRITLSSTKERTITLIRLLHHLCRERPAILWFDDLHWSQDSIECVRTLLTDPDAARLPLLIVGALNDDVQHIIPKSHIELIRQVVEHPHTTEMMLRPLHERDQDELIRHLLPVEPPLDREVKNLSRGNPMFIVQLIGDWVQNDILEAGTHGYQLKKDATPFLPTTLNQLWNTRLAKLIRTVRRKSPGVSELQVRSVLELTAVLGQEIQLKEWGIACAKAQLSIPAALIPTLVDQGFANTDHRTLSFTHDLLRDQLVRTAKQDGRWRKLHLAAATMLDSLYTRATPGAPQRLLYHLVEAQEYALAIQPLQYLIKQSILRCEYPQAERYARQFSELAQELHLAPDHLIRGQLALQQATLALHMDGPALANHIATRALEAAKTYRWDELLSELLLFCAQLHLFGGELSQTKQLTQAASEIAAERGDGWGLARSFLLLAQLDLLQGKIKPSKRYVRDAIELIDALPTDEDQDSQRNLYALAYSILGSAHRADRDPNRASVSLQQSLRYSKEVGHNLGVYLVRTQHGHLARDRQDHLVAERFYLDAHKDMLELEHSGVFLPHLSYALSLLELERFEDALQMLDEDIEHINQTGQRLYLGCALIAKACALAALDQLEPWRQTMAAYQRWALSCDTIEPDKARYLLLCATYLERNRRWSEALQALHLAKYQLEALSEGSEQLKALTARQEYARAQLAQSPTAPFPAITSK